MKQKQGKQTMSLRASSLKREDKQTQGQPNKMKETDAQINRISNEQGNIKIDIKEMQTFIKRICTL